MHFLIEKRAERDITCPICYVENNIKVVHTMEISGNFGFALPL